MHFILNIYWVIIEKCIRDLFYLNEDLRKLHEVYAFLDWFGPRHSNVVSKLGFNIWKKNICIVLIYRQPPNPNACITFNTRSYFQLLSPSISFIRWFAQKNWEVSLCPQLYNKIFLKHCLSYKSNCFLIMNFTIIDLFSTSVI